MTAVENENMSIEALSVSQTLTDSFTMHWKWCSLSFK